jgi:hypothetical protein
MARIWRMPGVLMTACVVLYAISLMQPRTRYWATTGQLGADLLSVAIMAFLAWRVTRGSLISRVLVIVYIGAWIQGVLWSADMRTGGLVSLSLLVIYFAQIALLVSTPIYERTRKDWAGRPPSTARLWPTPPWWMAATALAGGLLITLVFLGSEDFRSVPCATPSATPARCVTLVQGFPVHFLGAIPSDGFAAPIIYKGAAAEDMAIWTALSFAACYLFWLPRQRPTDATAVPIAAPV